VLHHINIHKNIISHLVDCSIPTVNHWIHHYEHNHNLNDDERSGRPTKLEYDDVERIVVVAKQKIFTTPKEIKHDLDIHTSIRTIRRHLNDEGLFGRVSQGEYEYSEEELRYRANFGNG
jgi:transposase